MTNKRLNRILEQVKHCARSVERLSDEQLQAKTGEFKKRLGSGATLNQLLPEAFAVVCEADRRVLGMYPFDVQILGGIALHLGYLAEMNTGEGKTLTATMPLYLNALTGKSTILVTANNYLACRDAEEMGPVYEFLGLSVRAGVRADPDGILENDEKREIYAADIVYTTHGALGFDYLLNNLVTSAGDRFLREFYYVIIDEADSVLLDAAQMPLVISGSPRVQSNLYKLTDFFVTSLIPDKDYEEEEKKVWLTRDGVKYAENFFGIKRFYSPRSFEINRHVVLALRSHSLFEKGKSYVVSEKGEVTLLDNGTGRLLPGMKLRGGQHQALEAKEGLPLSQETRSVASVTFQNLFLAFPKFAGMSGTIAEAKKELLNVYKKRVVIIPPNKPLQRVDLPGRFFKTSDAQYEAAIEEVLSRHSTGQPVLVVTSKIIDSEEVSRLLTLHDIPHSVLNANNAFWEAQMIKEAGQLNAVTVSTGMAGRGTDIRLGEGVKELGGLAVIGIGCMSNARLERQAKGRSGRQGEPGVSQFFYSLEDDIVASVGEKRQERLVSSGREFSQSRLKRVIIGAQKLGEELAVEQRKRSVDFDKIAKRQSDIIYDARNRLLDGHGLTGAVFMDIVERNISAFLDENHRITAPALSRFLLDNMSYNLNTELLARRRDKLSLEKALMKYARELYVQKRRQFPSKELMAEYIRKCALNALDNAWVEEVDYLQQLQYAIPGRSTAQRNPVFEYGKEASESFSRMLTDVRRQVMRNVFLSEVHFDSKMNMSIIYP